MYRHPPRSPLDPSSAASVVYKRQGRPSTRLRARFYMERMGVAAALDAVPQPAGLGGRPFAPDGAERLVDDLRQVRVPGQQLSLIHISEPTRPY